MKRIVSTLVVLIPLFGAVSAQAKVVKAMRSCPRTPSSWTVAGSPAGFGRSRHETSRAGPRSISS